METKQMAVMHMQIHSEVQTQAFHFYCDVRNLLKRNEDISILP